MDHSMDIILVDKEAENRHPPALLSVLDFQAQKTLLLLPELDSRRLAG